MTAIVSGAKKTGKNFFIALSTTIGACINWLYKGKHMDLQREKMGQVVCNLEERLRKVEIELLRISDLSPSRIQELKQEKQKLLAEIDAVSRAAGIKHRICSSRFQ